MTIIIKEGENLTKVYCVAACIKPVKSDTEDITLTRLFLTDDNEGEIMCPDTIFDGSPYCPEIFFESDDWQDSLSLTQFKETW